LKFKLECEFDESQASHSHLLFDTKNDIHEWFCFNPHTRCNIPQKLLVICTAFSAKFSFDIRGDGESLMGI
jgi:hypothetical protein